MCLNCGCGDYWDKRGKATNITMDDVEKAAKGEGMTVEETAREVTNGLNAALRQLKSRKK
jgi:hypothetical protein